MGKTARNLRPKHLGRKLAQIRRQLQLSQNGLIRSLGFTDLILREEVSAFERGVRVPPVVFLLSIARSVNISVEVLIDDELELPAKFSTRAKSESGRRKGVAKRALRHEHK